MNVRRNRQHVADFCWYKLGYVVVQSLGSSDGPSDPWSKAEERRVCESLMKDALINGYRPPPEILISQKSSGA